MSRMLIDNVFPGHHWTVMVNVESRVSLDILEKKKVSPYGDMNPGL